MNRFYVAAAVLLLAAVAAAEPGYTGYSGAPGTNGSCASSCHGSGVGAIQIVGFPVAYELGQSYEISVFKQSGSSISNFNASVRVGTTAQTAGTITAGYRTATYSTGNEPNGIHLSGSNQDSCTFTWTAPDTGVGDVRLYLAGHQGNEGGPNTDVILTASPPTAVSEDGGRRLGLALSLEPTVASGPVAIRLSAPLGSTARLRVVDRSGRLVARLVIPESGQPFFWNPLDQNGRRLAAGTYLVVLRHGGELLARKLVVR